MRAYRENKLEAGSAPGNLIFHLKMVIIANVLHQMIQASEPIGTPVKFAILARVFGILGAEGFKMAIENIESGKESPAFAPV